MTRYQHAAARSLLAGLIAVIASFPGLIEADAAPVHGQIRWVTVVNGVDSSPVVEKGVLYIGSADDKLYALDAETGAALWATNVAGVASSPEVAKDLVYIGSDSGNVYALTN